MNKKAFKIVFGQFGLVKPKYFQSHHLAHKVISTTMYKRSVPTCPANMDNNKPTTITVTMNTDFPESLSTFSLKLLLVFCMLKFSHILVMILTIKPYIKKLFLHNILIGKNSFQLYTINWLKSHVIFLFPKLYICNNF